MKKVYVDQDVFEAMIKKQLSSKTTWFGLLVKRYLGRDGKIYVMEFDGSRVPSYSYFVEEEI